MALSRVLSPLLFPPPSSLPHPRLFTRALSVSASISAPNSGDQIEVAAPKSQRRWKPMCLYYTQDKCTMMNDRLHFEKFSHSYLMDLEVNASEVYNLRPQNLDYFLVLDLEGKVEILEFPVVMIDAKTMRFIDSFHRFVRPCKMSEQRITEYIEGKYGKLGVEQVWHDTSILFKDVLHDFEIWMAKHHLWNEELPGALHRAAFVTWHKQRVSDVRRQRDGGVGDGLEREMERCDHERDARGGRVANPSPFLHEFIEKLGGCAIYGYWPLPSREI